MDAFGVAFIPVLLGYAAVPAAIAVAVLRYRLYEIDRIIAGTLSWATVTGVLVVVFAGLVVGLQALLSDVTQGQTLAVAASTLAHSRSSSRFAGVCSAPSTGASTAPATTVSSRRPRLPSDCGPRSTSNAVAGDLTGSVERALRPSALGLWLKGSRPMNPSSVTIPGHSFRRVTTT